MKETPSPLSLTMAVPKASLAYSAFSPLMIITVLFVLIVTPYSTSLEFYYPELDQQNEAINPRER